MSFRGLLVFAAAAAWALALYLASHVSNDPQVLGRWSEGYAWVVGGAFAVAALLTTAHLPPVYRMLHQARLGILAIALALAVILLVLELLVRFTDPYGLSYYAAISDYIHDMVPDDELHYRHRSGARATYGGVDVSFEEIAGLRERPIGPKAEGEYRVLVLGDSVVFGWGVPVEDTFTRRLEPLLGQRLGRPVRTINSGVCSYATVPELLFLKRHGARIDPDLVLLVYVENDVVENVLPPPRDTSFRGKSPPQAIGMLLGYSWVYRLAVHVLGHVHSFPPTPLDRAAPGWKASMAAMGEIADWCKARGNPFAVVLWRYRGSALTDAEWKDLSVVAAEKGFLLADMAPAFKGKDMRLLTNSAVDSHPNPRGHEVAARRIDEVLAPLLPAR